MGQIVYGDSFGIIEGLFFMGGTLGMGYLTFSNYQNANSSFDEYSQNGQTDAFYQDKWDEYEKYKKDSQLFMYITIGVYAINFLDAFFSGRRVERTEVSSFSLNNRFYAFANFSKEDRGINFGYMKAF